MSEIVRIRQQQVESRDKVAAMEARLVLTEKKQRNMMGFLARALTNPEFALHLNSRRILRNGCRKRRLAAESLPQLEAESLFFGSPSVPTPPEPVEDNDPVGDPVEEAIWDELFGNDPIADVKEEIVDIGDDDFEELNELVDQFGYQRGFEP